MDLSFKLSKILYSFEGHVLRRRCQRTAQVILGTPIDHEATWNPILWEIWVNKCNIWNLSVFTHTVSLIPQTHCDIALVPSFNQRRNWSSKREGLAQESNSLRGRVWTQAHVFLTLKEGSVPSSRWPHRLQLLVWFSFISSFFFSCGCVQERREDSIINYLSQFYRSIILLSICFPSRVEKLPARCLSFPPREFQGMQPKSSSWITVW